MQAFPASDTLKINEECKTFVMSSKYVFNLSNQEPVFSLMGMLLREQRVYVKEEKIFHICLHINIYLLPSA